MMHSIKLEPPTGRLIEPETLEGFRHFWLKTVRGFRPDRHCYECLIGDRVQSVTNRLAVGSRLELEIPSTKSAGELFGASDPFGTVLYLCGVAGPFNWSHNFHLPFALTGNPQDRAEGITYNGFRVVVEGARPVAFSADAARSLFPDHGIEFLTCRNFQFGAEHFHTSKD